MKDQSELVTVGAKTGCQNCQCGGNCHKEHPFDLTEKEVLGIFSDCDALLTEGHFVYTSGRHGTNYVNKDLVYTNPESVSILCRAIAVRFMDLKIDTVIAPAIGGVILSQWTAFHLSEMTGKRVKAAYAEKTSAGMFEINGDYDKFIRFSDVLVVEDVLTTGGSARKVVDSVRRSKGRVVGVGAIWNRGKVNEQDLGCVPVLNSLVNWHFVSWTEEECLLCKRGDFNIDTTVGMGRVFLEKKLGVPVPGTQDFI